MKGAETSLSSGDCITVVALNSLFLSIYKATYCFLVLNIVLYCILRHPLPRWEKFCKLPEKNRADCDCVCRKTRVLPVLNSTEHTEKGR